MTAERKFHERRKKKDRVENHWNDETLQTGVLSTLQNRNWRPLTKTEGEKHGLGRNETFRQAEALNKNR